MGTVTLQTIFQDAFSLYAQTDPLPAHVRRAARAIMPCRTAALGGHVQECPDGHCARIWDHSCRHRSCPQCAYRQTERWLALQCARLLAGDHSPVIFTLPHALHPLWWAHVPVMTSLLLQAVRDTLCPFLAAPTYLGAQPGIIAALHTWSQTLVLHPHVHGLVTGGGLTPAGAWQAVRHGFLLPVRVVMAVFRGKLLAALRQAWERGEAAGAAAGSAVAQPPAPFGPPEADPMECVGDGARPPRGGRGDLSGALSTWWSDQKRAPGGLGRCPCHVHLSRAPCGGPWRTACVSTQDLAGRGRSATAPAACAHASDAHG